VKLVFLKNQDKDRLNEFVNRHAGGSLSQTWAWGEFQQAAGFKIWRLGIEDQGVLLAAATVLKYDMPYGKWHLYTPHLI
jgi:peptidoglycan pentaglycine glycine transferase (the first glycine)